MNRRNPRHVDPRDETSAPAAPPPRDALLADLSLWVEQLKTQVSTLVEEFRGAADQAAQREARKRGDFLGEVARDVDRLRGEVERMLPEFREVRTRECQRELASRQAFLGEIARWVEDVRAHATEMVAQRAQERRDGREFAAELSRWSGELRGDVREVQREMREERERSAREEMQARREFLESVRAEVQRLRETARTRRWEPTRVPRPEATPSASVASRVEPAAEEPTTAAARGEPSRGSSSTPAPEPAITAQLGAAGRPNDESQDVPVSAVPSSAPTAVGQPAESAPLPAEREVSERPTTGASRRRLKAVPPSQERENAEQATRVIEELRQRALRARREVVAEEPLPEPTRPARKGGRRRS